MIQIKGNHTGFDFIQLTIIQFLTFRNSTPTASGENSPLAVPFASPPNAGILQRRLQDHKGRQEIEGRALEVLEDSQVGSGKFGRRFNLGSPEQHVQGQDPHEYHEGNPFLRVLAHGGRQDHEGFPLFQGPQDYEARTLNEGTTFYTHRDI